MGKLPKFEDDNLIVGIEKEGYKYNEDKCNNKDNDDVLGDDIMIYEPTISKIERMKRNENKWNK